MYWMKATLITTFLSTAAMAMPSGDPVKDFKQIPGTKLMMECDPSYVAMAKELSAFTMVSFAAAFNAALEADEDKITKEIEQMKTCEDFQQTYKNTLDVLAKIGVDYEAYVREGKGRQELNDLVELLRKLSTGQAP